MVRLDWGLGVASPFWILGIFWGFFMWVVNVCKWTGHESIWMSLFSIIHNIQTGHLHWWDSNIGSLVEEQPFCSQLLEFSHLFSPTLHALLPSIIERTVQAHDSHVNNIKNMLFPQLVLKLRRIVGNLKLRDVMLLTQYDSFQNEQRKKGFDSSSLQTGQGCNSGQIIDSSVTNR